jgi:acetyl-CoA carboxylase beta subunit
MLDLIVDRREMKGTIAKALRFMGQQPVAAVQPEPAAVTEP